MTRFEALAHSPAKLLSFGAAARVAAHLREGGLAVLPTETGYMIAADATDERAVEKVFHAKERSLANPMHVAFGSLRMVHEFARLDEVAERLVRAFTPGPLTVVVPQSGRLPDRLVTLNGTVGVRVPDHPATLQVVDLLGSPVTATSLNRSGEESRPLDHAFLPELDWSGEEVVPVLEDLTSITQPLASTLVLVEAGTFRILRQGPVTLEQIEAAAKA
ncbi:L-threonylcarbamoyladenylate synthase [Dactylosporangium sp. AC04546]|uniref:L-threonylcarbamoyladenylate synthase n=1 Tax=Dactylosporangium sp. AC04546 TaxID=2862460 RepID=UPI001EDD4482|nr:L-threonylcarbamoyladenylate synthase [Dactylosporangium sp. AC04546]WVK85054.1 L-threonylcarbamoyladenylate synthase [Dactylosporangium sp. AC04546]